MEPPGVFTRAGDLLTDHDLDDAAEREVNWDVEVDGPLPPPIDEQ